MGTIFLMQNYTKKPQNVTCYLNLIHLQCDFGFVDVYIQSNSSQEFRQKDFKSCQLQVIVTYFTLGMKLDFTELSPLVGPL